MKKKYTILFVIVVVCLLALAGCNGESEVIADGDGSPEQVEVDMGGTNMPIEEENKVNTNMMGDEIFITYFSYLSSGYTLEGAYDIEIDSDGYLIISYLDYGFVYGDASNDTYIPLSMEKYRELVQIIEENDLVSWDGWQDEDPNLQYVDGGCFTLEIQWSDGSSVSAESQPPYPENFTEADQAIHTFFKSFRKEWKRINGVD